MVHADKSSEGADKERAYLCNVALSKKTGSNGCLASDEANLCFITPNSLNPVIYFYLLDPVIQLLCI